MLPLPFHPNESSRAVLSIALIFVFSSGFCFFLHGSIITLQRHWDNSFGAAKTKKGAAALGHTLGPFCSWSELRTPITQVNPQEEEEEEESLEWMFDLC